MENQSPWLHQLNRVRPIAEFKGRHRSDVAVIGGGIAGISTAYFLLRYTDKTVTLLEADNIAHGATGHNGGFLATYFERTFSSLVQEFGLKSAAEGQRAIETSWDLLEEMRADAGLKTPMWQFIGYAACATYEELLLHLRNNALRKKAGLETSLIIVSEEAPCLSDLPQMYRPLYTLVPKRKILDAIETDDESYFAVLPARKGAMNSAAFCEELVSHLLAAYPSRFRLAEHTPVKKVVVRKKDALCRIGWRRFVTAESVVLCTNGFENITLVNKAGLPINEKFHHLVRGIVGYMAGYLEETPKKPTEISYLPKGNAHDRDIYDEAPYYYLTRRPFVDNEKKKNLICIGGPEALMDDTNNYRREHPYPAESRAQIDNFLKYTYKHGLKSIDYKFLWHGLMGFTPNGVRLIGPEPCNPRLLYNLGCNGVGLLPSIYGGRKIARWIAGETLDPSIFDPKDARL